jgi:RNA polymerase sigma factor FliA
MGFEVTTTRSAPCVRRTGEPKAEISAPTIGPAQRRRGRMQSIERTWEMWADHRDPAAQERLIVHYSPLVKFVAGRVGAGLPTSVDRGDLVNAGMLGLMGALERFDVRRGVKFETFAAHRIRGAIIDALRALDWVPRSVRVLAHRVEAAISEVEGRLGHNPSDEELAAQLHIDTPTLNSWLSEIAATTIGALDQALIGGGESRWLADDISDSPQEVVERRDVSARIRHELRRLPPREMTVLDMYYEEGLTFAEIARALGVTETRVAQIHAKAVIHLRFRLTSTLVAA